MESAELLGSLSWHTVSAGLALGRRWWHRRPVKEERIVSLTIDKTLFWWGGFDCYKIYQFTWLESDVNLVAEVLTLQCLFE